MAIVVEPVVPQRAALQSFSDLQASIADWLNRTDLGDRINEFISLTEVDMIREIRQRSIETMVTGTTDGDVIYPPANTGIITRIDINVGQRTNATSFFAPDSFTSADNYAPQTFSMSEGGIRLYPNPGVGYSYAIHYIPTIVALSDIQSTNWLLTNYPDVYLWGACAYGSMFLKDDTGIARFAPRYEAAKQAINGYESAKRYPAYGGLRIRPRR